MITRHYLLALLFLPAVLLSMNVDFVKVKLDKALLAKLISSGVPVKKDGRFIAFKQGEEYLLPPEEFFRDNKKELPPSPFASRENSCDGEGRWVYYDLSERESIIEMRNTLFVMEQ